jgi:cytidylate kinase
MKERVHEEPKIMAAAERRMQAWARSQELAGQGGVPESAPTRRLGPYITLSRQAGAGGGEIAQLVGAQLGWEVLDKALVDRVAERYRLSRPMLDFVDETSSSWVHNILGPWLDRGVVAQEKYLVRLTRVMLAAARRGNVVIVGRGAQFLLPRKHGLAVRVVAPLKFRVARLARLRNCTAAEAQKLVAELDQGRKQFVEQFFHHDVEDPTVYDLVLNVDHLGCATAAELIVAAYRAEREKAAGTACA